ncbi:hypothetical protein C2845_PM03G33620 [Panicum miliaceum]|uniref:DUF8039 domain-containing protein n=1 Tax=Panicum miliaceum TaxID=4540 RepID=A0A3L6T8K6_PANMI|nr:hypothetical protein C2845_PM03G33620 [Panicum miliaceum]
MEKHPFLKKEDWDQFVEITNSEDFGQKSQEMKEMRSLHTKLHKMGRNGYAGKRKEWEEEEDEKYAAEGKENPWMQFPGRSRPYLRARSEKGIESGDISFSSPSMSALAERVKAITTEAIDGSFSGVRENDVLTQALENPEHRVPVQQGYVVVQPTSVWANTRHIKLPIPIDDEITTIGEARFQRIQWPSQKDDNETSAGAQCPEPPPPHTNEHPLPRNASPAETADRHPEPQKEAAPLDQTAQHPPPQKEALAQTVDLHPQPRKEALAQTTTHDQHPEKEKTGGLPAPAPQAAVGLAPSIDEHEASKKRAAVIMPALTPPVGRLASTAADPASCALDPCCRRPTPPPRDAAGRRRVPPPLLCVAGRE